MELAIADPAEVEVERDGVRVLVPGSWRPPEHRILPELLEQARAVIAERLKPADAEGIAKVMRPLMLTTKVAATEGMSDDKAFAFFQAKAFETTRLLTKAGVPLDLLQEAADRCAVSSKFFPEVAELMEHIRPELERRQRQRDRIDRVIATKDAPKPVEVFVPEPELDRLKGNIARWRSTGRFEARAIESERRLAEIEQREIADWAREVDIEPQPTAAATTPPPLPPSPSQQRVGAVARAVMRNAAASRPQPWRDGQPLYQRPAEEPPPPTEIIEGGEYDGVEP